jgi:uncharacterized protein YjbJ (UPF0337 family)
MNDDTMNPNNDPNTNNSDLGQQGLEHRGQGKMDQLGGKVQEGWGKLTGDKGDELQGKMKQGKGNLEEGAGKAESNLDDVLNN